MSIHRGKVNHLLSSCALARHRLSRRPSLSLTYDYTHISLVRVQIIYNINTFSVEIKDILIVPFQQLLIYLYHSITLISCIASMSLFAQWSCQSELLIEVYWCLGKKGNSLVSSIVCFVFSGILIQGADVFLGGQNSFSYFAFDCKIQNSYFFPVERDVWEC